MGGMGGRGGTSTKRYFITTKMVTSAAQALIEVQEIDINNDQVTSQRISRVLKKMRLSHAKQSKTGNRGWMISIDDLYRWSRSYGLDIEEITGIQHFTQILSATPATPATPTRASCERMATRPPTRPDRWARQHPGQTRERVRPPVRSLFLGCEGKCAHEPDDQPGCPGHPEETS